MNEMYDVYIEEDGGVPWLSHLQLDVSGGARKLGALISIPDLKLSLYVVDLSKELQTTIDVQDLQEEFEEATRDIRQLERYNEQLEDEIESLRIKLDVLRSELKVVLFEKESLQIEVDRLNAIPGVTEFRRLQYENRAYSMTLDNLKLMNGGIVE